MAILVQSNKKPSVSFPSQTGAIVTFNSQYAGLPLNSHTVDIDSVSGVSAINIGAVGANVWDETTKQGYYHANGGYHVNVSGQLCSNTFIAVQPNTTYRFVKPNTRGDVLFYDENGTYLNQYIGEVRKNGTFTTPSGCYKININLGNNYGATYNNDVIIAYPAGTYTTINIGQTVNKATYNARTGVMEVTQPTVQTIQLAPCPIDTLEGVNNIWADTGETTAQYIKIG
jgi:hypothetical protein